jgi:hypothetical protein
MTFTFDGNDIQDTYGLRVSSVSGLEDREKFKDILPYWDESDSLTKYDEKTVTAHLFGYFDTSGELYSAVAGLDGALDATAQHFVEFTELEYSFACVTKNGFRTRIYGTDRCTLEIDLPLTIYTTG